MSTTLSTRSLIPLLVAFTVLVCLGEAFVFPGTTCSPTRQWCNGEDRVSSRERHSVSLFAKKKRRRRKNKSSATQGQQLESLESSSISQPGAGDTDELPDFDLGGDEEVEEKKPKKINPGEITSNMMGSGMASSGTLKDLISDRTLESRFEFDEKGDPNIPDFVDLAKASSTVPSYNPDTALSTAGVGKKKQKQAERMARAIAAKEAEQPEETFMSQYFPQLLDEKGDFSAVKVLEQGAWVGIFLLVGWEAYINSPFFERAAPLAPVVFEIVM